MLQRIEKDIPIPTERSHGNRRWHALYDMNVGDSIFVKHKDAARAVQASYTIRHRYDKRYTWARERGGIRIWRTA